MVAGRRRAARVYRARTSRRPCLCLAIQCRLGAPYCAMIPTILCKNTRERTLSGGAPPLLRRCSSTAPLHCSAAAPTRMQGCRNPPVPLPPLPLSLSFPLSLSPSTPSLLRPHSTAEYMLTCAILMTHTNQRTQLRKR